MKHEVKRRFANLMNTRKWAYGLFWSWNLIFLAFMFLGFAPQLVPEMVRAVQTGDVPAAFLAYALILTLIPAVAVLLGLTLLRRKPEKLFALGYGVEGPLMLLLALRFFVVREMTPAVATLLVTAGLGMGIFLWQLLDPAIDRRRPTLSHVRLIGLTLLLVTGLYASLWLGFYAVPLIAKSGTLLGDFIINAWRGITDLELRDLVTQWRWIPFWILGVVLLIYSATLFVAMPIVVSVLYTRAWWRGLQALLAGYSKPRAVGLTTAVVAIFFIIFIRANQQPQHVAFALLERPPTSPAEAQSLQAQETLIRDGLLNAYLAPQRYVSTVGGLRHVSNMYEWAFDISTGQAKRIQSLYETVARPILYDPVNLSEAGDMNGFNNQAFVNEPTQAAELYEAYFDQNIIDGEHETVVRAVRSTWSVDQARAAWQLVDDREVYLRHQEINVAEQGDWAEIELYEVYKNQTGQQQEVVYYFSLPETAVITGLWLGESPNRAERFAYRVSPRGTAQAVYRNEVQRRVDPALVEQIGPRQYRLRLYPVEPQTRRWDETGSRSSIEDGPPLHMWLTWRVLVRDDAWPLPQLAEKRNVYWDRESTRLLNGKSMSVDEAEWLPALAPASRPTARSIHRVDFPNGQTVVARPATGFRRPGRVNGLKLALVLDRSRSMALHAGEVETALAELAVSGAVVDVYLTASEYSGEPPRRVDLGELDPESISYGGGQNAAELLVQFAMLQKGQAYDAILVLTDGSGYELDDSGAEVTTPSAPVWMVHLGGDFPIGYGDATLQAIQSSGGGVAASLDEALSRMAFGLEGNTGATTGVMTGLVDETVWLVVPTATADAMSGDIGAAPIDNDFAPLAARQLILFETAQQRDTLGQLDTLDQLHQIAKEQSIVTPYSSMIVLVERRQQELLNRLETSGDRYQREYEDIGETVPQNAFAVTGVPEPEEWLLLALTAGMLIWYWSKTRRRLQYS